MMDLFNPEHVARTYERDYNCVSTKKFSFPVYFEDIRSI